MAAVLGRTKKESANPWLRCRSPQHLPTRTRKRAIVTCGSHIPVVLTGDYGTLPVSVSHSEPNKERGQKIISISKSKTENGKSKKILLQNFQG